MNTAVKCERCGAPTVGGTVCDSCGLLRVDPLMNAILGERWRVHEPLGEGGMGKVYRGTHLELGTPVAIKCLHRHWSQMPELRGRFRREALALSQLRHPGIVSVLDFGDHDGDLYMVMELLRGTTVSALLKKGPFPIERVWSIFGQVLEVLEVAHAAKIVHRDVKPDNVMILEGSKDTRIKLLDFGLARMENVDERLTATGAIQGTPIYMSPEQCRGELVGPSSDIYSLGILLYEVLAGVVPFDGVSTAALMTQHLFVEPPRIATVGHKRIVPRGLEDICRRALAKEAAGRPSATELRVELAAAFRGEDASSLAMVADEERSREAMKTRATRSAALRSDPPSLGADEKTSGTSRSSVVHLRVRDDLRRSTFRDLLSVNGYVVEVGEASKPFDPVQLSRRGVRIAVIDVAEATSRELESLNWEVAMVPLVVVDVPNPTVVVDLLHRGVAEFLLIGASEADLLRKVRRALRNAQVWRA